MNTARLAEVFLRGVLLFSACGLGISVFAVVAPPEMAYAHLERISGYDVNPPPHLNYWLRMGGASLTFVALLHGFSALHPDRCPGLTRALLCFNLALGGVMFVAGRTAGLGLWSYFNDVIFCSLTGVIGLVALRLRKEEPAPRTEAEGELGELERGHR